MSHTPGPWTAKPMGGRILLNGSNCYEVTEVFNDEGGFNPADICLMAAAPDLLHQLKAMVSGAECECEAVGYDHPLCDVCHSRMVIAKAEGRA